jgi:predicted RNA-binding Zn ribbon-like protein
LNMTESTRPPPFFIADNRALDFLNTVIIWSGKEIEWLSNGRDLLDWLEQAELISAKDLMLFQNKNALDECEVVATKARELREWFRGFVTAHAGHKIGMEALTKLETLNTLLMQDNYYRQIEAQDLSSLNSKKHEPSLHWQQNRRFHTPRDLLFPIAEAMGDLVCKANFEQVKFCEGPTCSLWFLDESKNHSRRWCTMAICVNRAKAALHRAKKKSAK